MGEGGSRNEVFLYKGAQFGGPVETVLLLGTL